RPAVRWTLPMVPLLMSVAGPVDRAVTCGLTDGRWPPSPVALPGLSPRGRSEAALSLRGRPLSPRRRAKNQGSVAGDRLEAFPSGTEGRDQVEADIALTLCRLDHHPREVAGGNQLPLAGSITPCQAIDEDDGGEYKRRCAPGQRTSLRFS